MAEAIYLSDLVEMIAELDRVIQYPPRNAHILSAPGTASLEPQRLSDGLNEIASRQDLW